MIVARVHAGLVRAYTLCHHASGCILNDLRTSGGLVVFAVKAKSQQPVGFPVPLVGFAEAFAGPPN